MAVTDSAAKKTELLLEKHINFIANYGKTHEVYVSPALHFSKVSEPKAQSGVL